MGNKERKINLLSGGTLYKEDSPFRCGYILVREPVPNDEELLVNPDFISDGTAGDRFIESLLIDKTIKINDLVAIDKIGVFIQVRILTYGFELNVPYTCPNCNTKQKIFIDVNEDISVVPPERIFEGEKDLTYQMKQGDDDIFIKFHPLTSGEEMEVLNTIKRLLSNKKVQNKRILSEKIVKCVDEIIIGKQKFDNLQAINEFLTAKISPLNRAKFVKYYESFFPIIDKEKEIVCPKCGNINYEEIPLFVEIFLSSKYI